MKLQDMKMQDMNLQYMASYENILHYSAVCISFKFEIFCMYGECVNVENLTRLLIINIAVFSNL